VKDGKAGPPGPGDTLGAVLRVATYVTTQGIFELLDYGRRLQRV
jgi:hypothetical protein